MSILKSKFITILIIAGIGWLSLSAFRVRYHNDAVDKEVSDIQAKVDNLEDENQGLESFLENSKNPKFIEKEIRKKLNYKSEDESLVFIYPDEGPSLGSESSDFSKQLANMPNYLKWFFYLIGY